VASTSTRPAWPAEELERVGACPACRSTRRHALHEGLEDRLFGAPGRWTLWRCDGCPTAYLDPRPSAPSIGRAYLSYFWHRPPEDGEAPPAGLAARLRRGARNAYLNHALGYDLRPAPRALGLALATVPGAGTALSRWVRHLRREHAAPRLLDVGCANGGFMLQMQALGWRVSGIDIDDAALAPARAAGLDVAHGTLEAPPELAAGGFDAVTLNHVIEHLPDPYAALRQAGALLRPGGVLAIATPNLRSLAHRMFGRDWLSLDPPRHLVLLSPDSLRAGLEGAGLVAVEQPRPARNLRSVIAPSAALAAGADAHSPPPAPLGLRLRGVLADELAQHRPDLAEELFMLARRP
jgi:2-polyprenyl-3-methyl-5-hydroxy-6-metoxy-1,4-benzoquinol methylase